MTNNYNSLTSYLNSSFNDIKKHNDTIVSEGIFDDIKKFFSGDSSKDKSTKKLGFFGALLAPFSSKVSDTKSSKDSFLAEYERQAKLEAENEKKRLEAELKAEDAAELARLKAEFEHNQNQLNIASQNRVKAFNATEKRLKDVEAKVKKNKLLFSASQNEALLNKIRSEGNDQNLEGNPLKEMKNLAMLIYIKPDGTIRSGDEIATELEKDDSDIKKYAADYNKLAQKMKKPILDSMKTDDFLKELETANHEAYENSNIDEVIESTKAEKESFEKSCKAFKAVKELKTSNKNNKEELEQLKDSPFKKIDGTDSFKTELIKELTEGLDSFKTDGNIDTTKIGARLEKLGVSKDIITKIKDAGIGTGDKDDIKKAIDELDDDDVKTALEETQKTISNRIEELETKIKNSLDLSDKDLSEEDAIAKVKKMYEDDAEKQDEMIKNIETYFSLNKEDVEKGVYDEEQEVSKNRLKNLTNDVKKAEDKKEKLKTQQDANKEARKRAEEAVKVKAENEMPDELKDKVEKELQGLEGDEQLDKDGNIYFLNSDKKPVQKPVNGTDKEQNDYIIQRNEHFLTLDLEQHDKQNSLGVKSIKKNDDDTYTIIYKDGSIDEKATKEDAITAKVNQLQMSRSKGLILKAKQDIANTLKEYIKDGELDTEKLKSLRDSDKDEDKVKYANLSFCIKNSDKIGDYFKDVDLIGNDTIEQIEKAFKKNDKSKKSEVADKFDDEEEKNDVNKNSDDYDDEDDEDDDLKDADDEFEDEGETKLKNPTKVWHKKKKKNGSGSTKNYYDKNGNSISPDEYNEKKERYKEKLKNKKSTDTHESKLYTELRNYLIERFS